MIVLFRALVMLGCLVVLPALALFGLPPLVQIQDLMPFGCSFPAPISDGPNGLEPAPVFVGEQSVAPYRATLGSPSDLSRPLVPATDHLGTARNPHTPPVEPEQYAIQVVSGPAAASGVINGNEPQQKRMRLIESRLRELGSSSYVLETWGANEGPLYRFWCRMSVNRDPQLHRHFEAVEQTPIRAMESVLREVELWRRTARPIHENDSKIISAFSNPSANLSPSEERLGSEVVLQPFNRGK